MISNILRLIMLKQDIFLTVFLISQDAMISVIFQGLKKKIGFLLAIFLENIKQEAYGATTLT